MNRFIVIAAALALGACARGEGIKFTDYSKLENAGTGGFYFSPEAKRDAIARSQARSADGTLDGVEEIDSEVPLIVIVE